MNVCIWMFNLVTFYAIQKSIKHTFRKSKNIEMAENCSKTFRKSKNIQMAKNCSKTHFALEGHIHFVGHL